MGLGQVRRSIHSKNLLNELHILKNLLEEDLGQELDERVVFTIRPIRRSLPSNPNQNEPPQATQ